MPLPLAAYSPVFSGSNHAFPFRITTGLPFRAAVPNRGVSCLGAPKL